MLSFLGILIFIRGSGQSFKDINRKKSKEKQSTFPLKRQINANRLGFRSVLAFLGRCANLQDQDDENAPILAYFDCAAAQGEESG